MASDDVNRLARKLRDVVLSSNENVSSSNQQCLKDLDDVRRLLLELPYSLPLYLYLAEKYEELGYPDLAAGSAYKALLLSDAAQDDSDEYHHRAIDGLKPLIDLLPAPAQRALADFLTSREHRDGSDPTQLIITSLYTIEIYRILSRSLLACGCYRTALKYCSQACKLYPDDIGLVNILREICSVVAQQSNSTLDLGNPSTWPDKGFVRRENYPWNDFEPDRLMKLDEINAMMKNVAPKLEVLAVDLPDLTGASNGKYLKAVKQLGVFATENIAPGEVLLDETSLLTANNKLQDALCDACSAELPELNSSSAEAVVSCPDCEVVFCSDACYNRATESYHPALCGMDVEAIAKDVPPAQAADSLYSLLLLRALAMSATQDCHPLDLKEIKYIWGDFHNISPEKHWRSGLPKTLPFSFEHNIRLPFHMLEKMDIDIFKTPQYEVWVFNTLYAKFRGTASARLSGLGGRAIRGPEVSAVHPMWCLANHSCDPNVSWEWGGSVKFWARGTRVQWERDGDRVKPTEAGIKKGEEVLNHYCDIDLPVHERREWARGALGGNCLCSRCQFEAGEAGEKDTLMSEPDDAKID